MPHPAKLVSMLQSYKSAVFNYTSNLGDLSNDAQVAYYFIVTNKYS